MKFIRRTVGLCKDCGHTWYMDSNLQADSVGCFTGIVYLFLLIFALALIPVFVTIWALRNKDLKSEWKCGIIFGIWILWIILAIVSLKYDAAHNASNNNSEAISKYEENYSKTYEDIVQTEVFTKDEQIQNLTSNYLNL